MKQPLLTVAALAVGLAFTLPGWADSSHIPGKIEMEGYQKVKVFQFEEQQTPDCTVKSGSVLKYYPDGRMKFEGDLMCKQALRGDEFEVEIRTYNSQGVKLFHNDFEKHHINQWSNQWIGMAEGVTSDSLRGNDWDKVEYVNLRTDYHR